MCQSFQSQMKDEHLDQPFPKRLFAALSPFAVIMQQKDHTDFTDDTDFSDPQHPSERLAPGRGGRRLRLILDPCLLGLAHRPILRVAPLPANRFRSRGHASLKLTTIIL